MLFITEMNVRMGDYISIQYTAEDIEETEKVIKEFSGTDKNLTSYYISCNDAKEYFREIGCTFYVYDTVCELHWAGREIPLMPEMLH